MFYAYKISCASYNERFNDQIEKHLKQITIETYVWHVEITQNNYGKLVQRKINLEMERLKGNK